jgi:hypothetical protein
VITATLYYVLVLAYPAHLKGESTFLNTALSVHRSYEACSAAGKKRAPQLHGSWSCHPLLVQPAPAEPGFDIHFTME